LWNILLNVPCVLTFANFTLIYCFEKKTASTDLVILLGFKICLKLNASPKTLFVELIHKCYLCRPSKFHSYCLKRTANTYLVILLGFKIHFLLVAKVLGVFINISLFSIETCDSDTVPHYSGDQSKKNGMVGACNMYGGMVRCI
jgi:hypothetical protein